jgi:hypothetical protein
VAGLSGVRNVRNDIDSAYAAAPVEMESSLVGRSEFYLMVGDGVVVPFQAVAGDVR